MLGKEVIIICEELSKQQVQIYTDACDYGVIATPEVKAKMKQAIEELRDLDKHFRIKKSNYKTGFSRNYQGQILIESSYNFPGKYNGYTFNIDYIESIFPLRKDKPENSFFTIDMRYSQDLNI